MGGIEFPLKDGIKSQAMWDGEWGGGRHAFPGGICGMVALQFADRSF